MQALISAASFLCEDVEADPCGSEGLRIVKMFTSTVGKLLGLVAK